MPHSRTSLGASQLPDGKRYYQARIKWFTTVDMSPQDIHDLGEYTIWQLRGKAEAALGAEFDLRSFHDYILALGSVPLDVLTDEVNLWIEEQR